MKIIRSDSVKNLEHNLKRSEFISYLMTSLFQICKQDPLFQHSENYSEIDKEINVLKNKISKKQNLLDQSQEMSKDLRQKLRVIEEEIYEGRAKTLEEMGSEL